MLTAADSTDLMTLSENRNSIKVTIRIYHHEKKLRARSTATKLVFSRGPIAHDCGMKDFT